ncbi:MAG: hypothetical protein JNN05_06810 [Candidatus Omnitrophica bacterium]|nr:hypothetical protein [Candidatus Omnitrophota bacterium]
MKTPKYTQRFLSLVVIVAFFSSTINASAQTALPKPLTVSFLYDFAQKLVQRGEVQEAQTLLKKILKSDPNNHSAQRLLQNLQKENESSVRFQSANPSEIAADIMFIQKNVVAIERRNRELEFAIRKILQENIFLFQSLSRQNQDLLQLRKKFFGYDDKSGKTTQGTENTDEILKSYEQQITERDQAFLKRNKEISQVMKDISQIGDVLENNQGISSELDSSSDIIEWKNDLTEKRAFLLEKALTLFEKNKDLTALHSELSLVSKSLKEANENYGQTVEEYETKIQKLNNVWTQDKARQQTEIDKLKEQIRTEKVKHVASKLVSGKEAETETAIDDSANLSKTSGVKFPTAKVPTAGVKNAGISDHNAVTKDAIQPGKVIEFPAEIKRLEQALKDKEDELRTRSREFDARIKAMKEDWAKEKTVDYQAKIRTQSTVPVSDSEFQGSDLYKSLNQELDRIKDQLATRESQVQKFEAEMSGHSTQLEQLQKKLTERENRLVNMDQLILTKDQQIAALKKELIAKEAQLIKKNAFIEELKARISGASPAGLKDLNKRTVTMKKMDDGSDKSVQELQSLVAELETQLNMEDSSKGSIDDIKNQLTESLEKLQQKDKEIADLKSRLDEDRGIEEIRSLSEDRKNLNDEVNKYQQTIDDLKKQLSSAEQERKQAKSEWEQANEKLSAMAEDVKKAQGASLEVSTKMDEYVQRISQLNGQLKDQSQKSLLEIEGLKNKLAKKDDEILDLRNRLAQKEEQVQQFYESIEKATQQLNTKSALSPNTTPSASDSTKKLATVEDDNNQQMTENADGNLQKRLKTLNKELQVTQERLATSTKQTDELNKKLAERDSEIKSISSQQKSVRKVDVEKLQKELAAIKQQSELTRLTIKQQEDLLAKSQKDASRKEKALVQVQDQLVKLKKQVDDYSSTIKEKDEQISLQKEALDHEIRKNETLSKKLKNVTQLIGMDIDDAGKTKATAEIKSSIKEYTVRERDFKKQINDIQDQLKASYVMIEDGETRIKTLKQRLSAREERIFDLENELNRLKSDEAVESSKTTSEAR